MSAKFVSVAAAANPPGPFAQAGFTLLQPADPATVLVLACGMVLGLNLLAFLAFALDKRRAIRREWRIPEATLLTLALAGGSLGAKLGQRAFRHKTRKEPFRSLLNLILLVQAVALMALAVIGWWEPGPG